MRPAIRAIVLTTVVMGALDIAAALIMAITQGSTAMRLLQFIASGLLGRKAFEGGMATAALGLALHFLIALAAVVVFWFARERLAVVRQWPVVSGLAYGLVVFALMNLVVLPLAGIRMRHALVPDLIQIAIHMFIIGLPTSLLLRRFSGARAS